jgi:hypothetical protein
MPLRLPRPQQHTLLTLSGHMNTSLDEAISARSYTLSSYDLQRCSSPSVYPRQRSPVRFLGHYPEQHASYCNFTSTLATAPSCSVPTTIGPFGCSYTRPDLLRSRRHSWHSAGFVLHSDTVGNSATTTNLLSSSWSLYLRTTDLSRS